MINQSIVVIIFFLWVEEYKIRLDEILADIVSYMVSQVYAITTEGSYACRFLGTYFDQIANMRFLLLNQVHT